MYKSAKLFLTLSIDVKNGENHLLQQSPVTVHDDNNKQDKPQFFLPGVRQMSNGGRRSYMDPTFSSLMMVSETKPVEFFRKPSFKRQQFLVKKVFSIVLPLSTARIDRSRIAGYCSLHLCKN